MKKQPEITEKTKQSFISVFCELYCQKPIEKITVQEIANKSGYNRSTFYQDFPPDQLIRLIDMLFTSGISSVVKNC